ncbi:septum formation family protein [Agromyces sp. SYSU K20354]|uniref:septum formation family protein n=1 Tax=Agromyces cavernae TaxID=2898659 RepID=UPI001E4F83B2|nr:septum formation family protein [Agromyces cavernae]MCD2443254.1 septum formation family protein [Agromyces cavernae]
MPARRSLTRLLVIGAAVAVALPLTGCSALGSLLSAPEPERDETTQEIIEGGEADVFALRVGDCLTMQEDAEVEAVPVVPCSEPHNDEVYFDFQLDDGEFPGDEAITTAAEDGCLAEFESFVGLPYESSSLDIGWYLPTADSWEFRDDRVVSCTIFDPAGEVTGSLAGAAY